MVKVQFLASPDGPRRMPAIFCPGCEQLHPFDERWKFNGDPESPTFSPSMLVNKDTPASRCHSFVTNGQIKFLGDCYHKLAGQTVELEDPHNAFED